MVHLRGDGRHVCSLALELHAIRVRSSFKLAGILRGCSEPGPVIEERTVFFPVIGCIHPDLGMPLEVMENTPSLSSTLIVNPLLRC